MARPCLQSVAVVAALRRRGCRAVKPRRAAVWAALAWGQGLYRATGRDWEQWDVGRLSGYLFKVYRRLFG